jgi:hypothetical protein
MLAEINQESDCGLAIEFYPAALSTLLDLDDLLAAFAEAREQLQAKSAFPDVET